MMVCLIFLAAIIFDRKNWRIAIKLHFENLSIFFKKSERTHILGLPPSCSFFFFFFCFLMTLHPSSTKVLFEWPLPQKRLTIVWFLLSDTTKYFAINFKYCCPKLMMTLDENNFKNKIKKLDILGILIKLIKSYRHFYRNWKSASKQNPSLLSL